MNRLIKLMFERRGYELDYYDKISKCGHDIPDNIETMCDVLKRYHDLHEHITLLTDFDMDGIMSGVIGFAGLAQLGFDVSLYMPDVTGGYGFHESDIDKIMDQYPNTKAILTADVGITSYGGIDRGSQLGVEMLITDHHRPELVLKNASVVVDPKIASDNDNIFSDICGASVLYYTLYRYAEKYDAANVPQIHRLRVFAGIGTVSDNMPLIYENRGFVTDAVDICRFAYGGDDTAENVENVNSIEGCEVYRRAFLGLHVIMKAFKEIGKFGDPSTLHEDFFGFYVAPVFNSIKRLGADIRLAYNVFFGGYQAALDSMEALFKLNEERKELVNEYFSMLTTVPQPWAPYVLMTNGSGGIRGLLAMNYVNLSHLPALVVGASDNGLSGSGRSPAWYPFADRMQVANIDGLRVAGHNGAFGVFIRDEAVIDKLLAGEKLPPKNQDHPLVGNYIGFRECHILSDWLLIYTISDDALILTASRTGTHSDVFDE